MRSRALRLKESMLFRFLSFSISLFPLFLALCLYLALFTTDRYVPQSDRHGRRTGTSHPQVVYNKRVGRYHDAGIYRGNENMTFSGCAWNMHASAVPRPSCTQNRMNRMTKRRMSGCFCFPPFFSIFSTFIFSELAFTYVDA